MTDTQKNDRQSEAQQLAEITRSIISMAQLDFDAPPPIRGGSALDAVAAGMHALGEELDAQFSSLQRATQRQTRAVEDLAHELRTPLTSILGSTEQLLSIDLDPARQRLMLNLREAALTMQRMVQDLQITQSGGVRTDGTPNRIQDSAEKVVTHHRQFATARGISLRAEYLGPSDATALCDAQRIEQILHNLVSNAIRHTHEGEVLVKTQVVSGGELMRVIYRVIDSGEGIDPVRQQDIFQRYVTTEATQGGTGLGLPISQRIAQAMGSSIHMESTPGVGSCFSFSLSLPVTTPATPDPSEDAGRQFPCRVLVVDDNDSVREVTSEMLRTLGCTVVTADSGANAISLASQGHFDLVLMDCHMPAMSGPEAAEKLIDQFAHLPIVAMTAYDSEEFTAQIQASGMAGQLHKPFTLQGLEQVVQPFRRDPDQQDS